MSPRCSAALAGALLAVIALGQVDGLKQKYGFVPPQEAATAAALIAFYKALPDMTVWSSETKLVGERVYLITAKSAQSRESAFVYLKAGSAWRLAFQMAPDPLRPNLEYRITNGKWLELTSSNMSVEQWERGGGERVGTVLAVLSAAELKAGAKKGGAGPKLPDASPKAKAVVKSDKEAIAQFDDIGVAEQYPVTCGGHKFLCLVLHPLKAPTIQSAFVYLQDGQQWRLVYTMPANPSLTPLSFRKSGNTAILLTGYRAGEDPAKQSGVIAKLLVKELIATRR